MAYGLLPKALYRLLLVDYPKKCSKCTTLGMNLYLDPSLCNASVEVGNNDVTASVTALNNFEINFNPHNSKISYI